MCTSLDERREEGDLTSSSVIEDKGHQQYQLGQSKQSEVHTSKSQGSRAMDGDKSDGTETISATPFFGQVWTQTSNKLISKK